MFTIFLAGDSTVQSYRTDVRPIAGWGQLLHIYFKDTQPQMNAQGSDWMGFGHASDSEFEQAITYTTDNCNIDNRAMAGRSSRSFLDEGRLEDLKKAMKPGDYLFIQFAHNDANREKEERYATTDEYAKYLASYADAAIDCGAQPVFVTAIAMRNCDDTPDRSFTVSFPEYRDMMIRTARERDVPVLDLGEATAEYLNKVGAEESKKLYMWLEPGAYPDGPYADGKQDNAHLQRRGAECFAGILARLIAASDDARLNRIKECIKL